MSDAEQRHAKRVAALCVAALVSTLATAMAACGSNQHDAGGVESDAGAAEATPDGGSRHADVLGFCDTIDASHVEFCTDFENDTGRFFGFDDYGRSTGASVGVSPHEGADLSSALDFAIVREAGTGEGVFVLKKLPAMEPSPVGVRYEVELDFRVHDASTISYAVLVYIGVVFSGDGLGIATYDGNVLSRATPKTVALNDNHEWHHAFMAIERAPDTSMVSTRVTIDSTLVDSDAGIGGGQTSPNGNYVHLGIVGTSHENGSLRVQFDNVVIRRW